MKGYFLTFVIILLIFGALLFGWVKVIEMAEKPIEKTPDKPWVNPNQQKERSW